MANLIYDAALSFGKRPTITTGTFPDVLNLGRTRAEDYYPGKEGTNADRDDLLELYGAGGAVVYDEREFRVYPVSEPDALPPAADGEHPRYIGYPYRGVFRSMPVLANNQMKKQRITTLIFRFLDSFLPLVSSIAGGRVIQTDTITNLRVPFSGVHSIPFPGTWDDDVQVELVSEGPEPVTILALNGQAQ